MRATVSCSCGGGVGGKASAGDGMFEEVWSAVQDRFCERYGRLEEMVHELYGDSLSPSAGELAQYF